MKKFTVKTASPEYIRKIANKYVSEDWITFDYLARLYDKGKNTISNLLYRGVAENILSDDIAEKVSNKVIHSYYIRNHNKMLRWEKADDERTIYKLKQKEQEQNQEREQERKIILQEIELVKFQIAHHVDIEDAPTLDELKDRLFHLEAKLERL